MPTPSAVPVALKSVQMDRRLAPFWKVISQRMRSADPIPLERRRWFVHPAEGCFYQVDDHWDCRLNEGMQTTSYQFVGLRTPPPQNSPIFTFEEVKEVYRIAQLEDLTLAEAALKTKPEMFAPILAETLKKAPRIGVMGV